MRKEHNAFAAASVIVLTILVTVLPAHGDEVNHPPCLCGPQLIPLQGSARNVYLARVRYSDPDNDPPAKVEVVIDGVAYPLRPVTRKIVGGLYQARITLPPGEHSYYFYTEDIRGLSERYPRYGVKPGPYVGQGNRIYNRVPVLTKGGYQEDYITGTKVYTFTVHYQDKDGVKPKAVRVNIDGIWHEMELLQGEPNDGIYYYQTRLKPGYHVYYFAGIDDCGSCVLHPAYGVIYGPNVPETENSAPRLIGDRLDPVAGNRGTIFSYYIEYRDPDNDPPARAEIFINGRPYRMRLVGGKPYCGLYRYQTRLYPGYFHNYYFYFADGKGGFCRYPESGYLSGPAVTSEPWLEF